MKTHRFGPTHSIAGPKYEVPESRPILNLGYLRYLGIVCGTKFILLVGVTPSGTDACLRDGAVNNVNAGMSDEACLEVIILWAI